MPPIDDWDDEPFRRAEPRRRTEPRRRAERTESAPAPSRTELRLERMRPDSRGFSRALWGSILVLSVLAAGFAVAGSLQGPRLDRAQLATDALIASAGSRLLLTTDQPIAPVTAEDVTVEPAASVTVQSDERSVTVTFDDLLRYDTEYTVRVAGVTSSSTGRTGDLVHTFTTPDPELFVLDRGSAGDPDVLRRTTLAGGEGEVVFEADRIQEYARTSDGFVVVTLDADDAPTVTRVSLADDYELPVTLPGEGQVSELAASEQGVFGFVFTPASGGASELVLYDEADQSALGTPIVGTGGPVGVRDWYLVPGTTSVVLHDAEGNLSLVDALTPEAASPLGTHAEVRGFVPGTLDLVVADPTGGFVVDLATGEQSALELAVPELDPALSTGRVLVVDEAGDYLLQLVGFADSGQVVSALLYVDETGEAPFSITPAADGSTVRDFCLSPNGQYAAVETVSVEGEPDGYPQASAYTAMTTIFVDLTTGTATRSIAGFAPDWC
ncbi:hypothetical protein [Desertivibrio insolitus]|uniref:hypothetical protein n=1 Tax=Herbiconiux sp. SYSU D00978 TaxID=2812562 RepID=UPI001A96404F|nr:hypothetical protein [Herbiconiux sp. SYSU D00978]